MAVAHYKIEIAFLEQMVFNSGHDQRRVPFADLRNKHADRIAPLLPQGPGQVIRPVIQLSGRRADQLLRSLRNRSARRQIGKHTSELQSRENLVCRLLLEKKKIIKNNNKY